MDLYEFINATPKGLDRIPKETKEPLNTMSPSLEEGLSIPPEDVETLRQERDNLAKELKALQERLASMEEELTRLRKGSSEFNALLQTFRSGKEELIKKVKDLESQLQGLEAEGMRLKGQIEEAILERDRAREDIQRISSDKDRELGQLKAELSSLSQKLTEYEDALQEARQVINNKDFEITQLSKSNVSLHELLKKEEEKVSNMAYERETLLLDLERTKTDFYQYMQKTKMAFAAICIALVIALGGLFIYFGKRPSPEQTRPIEPSPTVKDSTALQQNTATTETPIDKEETTIEGLSRGKEGGRILETSRPKVADMKAPKEAKKAKGTDMAEAKPLRPASISLSGIKVDLLPIEKSETHSLPIGMHFKPEPAKFYYLISITTRFKRYTDGKKSTIQIDFIDKNNKLASLSDAVKVEQVHYEKDKRGKVIRKVHYLVSLSNNFQVKGVSIGKPTKGIKRLIIL